MPTEAPFGAQAGVRSGSLDDGKLGTRLADRWYGMRAAGEEWRAQTVTWLNEHPPQGVSRGGSHPDPRMGSSWSWRLMLTTMARFLDIDTRVATPQQAQIADYRLPRLPTGEPRRVWLLVDGNTEADPVLEIRPEESTAWDVYLQTCFQFAMLLAYLYERQEEVLDPDAPAGLFVGNTDPITSSCYHQFAIAFLGDPLVRDCHPSWHCQCNQLRVRFNYAPPEHAAATDSLARQQIREMLSYREKITPISTARNLPPPSGPGTLWTTNPDLSNGGSDGGPDRDPRGRRTGA